MNLSLNSREFGIGAWPVARDYEVREGYLWPVGGWTRFYKPEGRVELPFELAKLESGRPRDVLRFARRWGLLGYDRQRPRPLPPDEAGEPLEWIKESARDLKLCLSIMDALERRSTEELVSVIRGHLGSGDSFWRDMLGPWSWEIKEDDDLDWGADAEEVENAARLMLCEIVSKNMEAIKPRLSFVDKVPEVNFKFTSLIEMAYVHVARLAMARSKLDRCEECGALFKKAHGLQRYCPPGLLYQESQCSYRNRYKRLKSKEVRK